MADLRISASELTGGWVSIAVEGEIDIATVGQFQKSIDNFFETGEGHLVVDLRPSGFMDSTGIRALVMADRRFHDAKRSFAIAVQGGPVSRLIELSGIRSTLTVVDTPEEAAGS